MGLELIRASTEDGELIWNMQLKAFEALLDKYQDFDVSPGSEPLEKVIERLKQPFTYYYLIKMDGMAVGAIRVVDRKAETSRKRVSPLFVLPEYQNRGIAQWALSEVERIHGDKRWQLDTILQERVNCRLYEKMGYKATGETKAVNERMTLVFYEK